MVDSEKATRWPQLPLSAWRDTRDTLHMYTQIVGKIRLALAPFERGWANVPFYVTARGFTTSAMPYGERLLEIEFDFVRHELVFAASDGRITSVPLAPARSVADIYAEVMAALRALDVQVKIWPVAVEVPSPLRCDEDRVHTSYDPEYAHRFWQILVRIVSVFVEYRAPFPGRHTPVQFFWGTFDLAYVRFSGRPAEPPPQSDNITRRAMDAQEIAAGFWTGDDRFPEAAFYCYAYPKPAGLEQVPVQPTAAFWSETLGEFLLSYEEVRRAPSAREAILEFLASSYDACATLAGWDSSQLRP